MQQLQQLQQMKVGTTTVESASHFWPCSTLIYDRNSSHEVLRQIETTNAHHKLVYDTQRFLKKPGGDSAETDESWCRFQAKAATDDLELQRISSRAATGVLAREVDLIQG